MDQVGLLDESYDFYFKDVEWCHRIQNHGFEVAYISEAEITHLGDQSLSIVREWVKKRRISDRVALLWSILSTG